MAHLFKILQIKMEFLWFEKVNNRAVVMGVMEINRFTFYEKRKTNIIERKINLNEI